MTLSLSIVSNLVICNSGCFEVATRVVCIIELEFAFGAIAAYDSKLHRGLILWHPESVKPFSSKGVHHLNLIPVEKPALV